MKKNIIFYGNSFEVVKNNTFNNVFCNRIFLHFINLIKMIGFSLIMAYFSG